MTSILNALKNIKYVSCVEVIRKVAAVSLLGITLFNGLLIEMISPS